MLAAASGIIIASVMPIHADIRAGSPRFSTACHGAKGAATRQSAPGHGGERGESQTSHAAALIVSDHHSGWRWNQGSSRRQKRR
ncbi:hypothetical protein BI347_16130 [Chromobacterium sphagni]|uniref:Uncharacterized protein n=1 Tax=Chromobacterium sphagni TaxID=1903179 RepID=A0A1S1WVB5_9NEIS|nr:hypothetical protein BI347_16130 [Chromobacterium sphagni]